MGEVLVMNPSTERFTDKVVREFPVLQDLACTYVLAYEGDYEFLRDARLACRLDGKLSIPYARGVLNCMRLDRRWVDRLREAVTIFDDFDQKDAEVIPFVRKSTATRVKVAVRFNRTWLLSGHRLGSLAHKVDNDRSFGILHVASQRLEFVPIVMCQSTRYVSYPIYTSFYFETELPRDKKLCLSCSVKAASKLSDTIV